MVVEDFAFETPKTKEFNAIRKNLNLDNKKSLMVLKELDRNVFLSSRNLAKSEVVTLSDLNTYSIMNASAVVFVESSVTELANLLNA
jgi:large subunit ribosomal protein L4